MHDAAEIRLVNKVVVHFGYLSTEQAVTEVANHVEKFWDPRMKRRLFELVDAQAGEFEPVALAAAARLRGLAGTTA
jgi:formate dehydrogenase subunit delta